MSVVREYGRARLLPGRDGVPGSRHSQGLLLCPPRRGLAEIPSCALTMHQPKSYEKQHRRRSPCFGKLEKGRGGFSAPISAI